MIRDSLELMLLVESSVAKKNRIFCIACERTEP